MLSVVMLTVVMLSVIMLSVVMLSVVMLSAVMLNVFLLSAVMLNVVMLSIMAPGFDAIRDSAKGICPVGLDLVIMSYNKLKRNTIVRFRDYYLDIPNGNTVF